VNVCLFEFYCQGSCFYIMSINKYVFVNRITHPALMPGLSTGVKVSPFTHKPIKYGSKLRTQAVIRVLCNVSCLSSRWSRNQLSKFVKSTWNRHIRIAPFEFVVHLGLRSSVEPFYIEGFLGHYYPATIAAYANYLLASNLSPARRGECYLNVGVRSIEAPPAGRSVASQSVDVVVATPNMSLFSGVHDMLPASVTPQYVEIFLRAASITCGRVGLFTRISYEVSGTLVLDYISKRDHSQCLYHSLALALRNSLMLPKLQLRNLFEPQGMSTLSDLLFLLFCNGPSNSREHNGVIAFILRFITQNFRIEAKLLATPSHNASHSWLAQLLN